MVSTSKQKILIVEDDQTVANVFCNTFLVEGYAVERASNGLEALALVESFRPDLIVLDLMIPEIDGVEVITRLRAAEATRELPIVVCSNFYLSQMVERAWKAGANHCLMKASCGRKQLLAVVQKVLAPIPFDSTQNAAQEKDEDFVVRAEKMFFDGIPETKTFLRNQLRTVIKADANQPVKFQELYTRIHGLAGSAALLGFLEIADFSSALEALIKELKESPESVSPSSLRTLVQAGEVLCQLLDRARQPEARIRKPSEVLVVDDELVACRMITYSLQRARLHPTVSNHPLEALELARQKRFEMVVLDINMPEMDGLELCGKIRALPGYEKTPIIFVTCMTDFQTRAQSTLLGGNDFITKPFVVMELTVKALMHVIRAQLQSLENNQCAVV